ncbi:MAG TPA: hypothetical protein VGQ65_05535 [Thermoanaerobaculia bacterium]|jgi:hypothetical protein|nr:hypothetical protein [Thermoanaerobaculia bacterium]
MADCVDCSVPLTESSIACLVKSGITIVGRHYTTDDTCLTLAEARLISAAGLQIIAIYESSDPSRVRKQHGGWRAGSFTVPAAWRNESTLVPHTSSRNFPRI